MAVGLIYSATVPMLTSDHEKCYFAGIGTVYTDGDGKAYPCMSLVLHFLPVQLAVWHLFCWQCNMTTVNISHMSACQPGVTYTSLCTRILQGCTNQLDGVYTLYRGVPDVCSSRTVTLSHICPLLQRSSVNFSQILKPYLSGVVHCLSFPGCLFEMLVRWPSRILLFFLKWSVWEIACNKCLGTIALAWIFCKLMYQPCFSLQWLLFCSKTRNNIFNIHITFQAVSWS